MFVSSIRVGPFEWPEDWSFVLLRNKINSLALYQLSYTPRSVASRPQHRSGCWWLLLDLKEQVSGIGASPLSLTSFSYAGPVPPCTSPIIGLLRFGRLGMFILPSM